jgi:UDP-N-acetylglucosamine 2-epimerase
LGTWSEAIKLVPVVQALQARPKAFEARTCIITHNGEMLDRILDQFGIVPDMSLNLAQSGQSLSGLGARVLSELDPVLVSGEPDWVLLQGDTTTAMMAALAARHRRVRVGHVGAGLRASNGGNLFPGEMNRVVVDHVSDLCFAPTERARRNLLREGIPDALIRVTGSTAIDALLTLVGQGWRPAPSSPLASLPIDRQWLLVMAHCRETVDQPLEDICQALQCIAEERGDQVHIVYPVNHNSRVCEQVRTRLANLPGVTLLQPVDYCDLVYLMNQCRLILTDSGGLQEAAPSLDKPVLVLGETTEQPEAAIVRATRIVGTRPERILAETYRLLDDAAAYARMASAPNPYGDGRAAVRIAEILLRFA